MQTLKNAMPRGIARWALASAAILALGYIDSRWCNIFVAQDKVTFANLFTGITAIFGLYLLNLRLENQDRQMTMQTRQFTAQAEKEVDDRFHSAIELLANSDTSTRTGALYSLYHVAVKSDRYCNQVVHVLCAYIRQKTTEGKYEEDHSENPSNEIQTAINLLFRGTVEGDGLYSIFSGKLSPVYLSGAYLAGADISGAECQGGIFNGLNCQGANFSNSNCQGAEFDDARCEGATFWGARCEGASFKNALCQGVDFRNSFCQHARFAGANCQEADFTDAKCEDADFTDADLQGAKLSDAQRQEFRGL